MIYFAHAEGTDLVKIGFTAGDPAKRVGELQTGCPHKLVLLASIEGSEQDEAKWHRDFAADRLNGEWFRLSVPLLLAVLTSLLKRPSAPAVKKQKSGKQPVLYAFSFDDNDRLQWSGMVVGESATTLRLELFDGMGFLSGELKDVPRERCRIFDNIDSFNEAIHPQIELLLGRKLPPPIPRNV